MSLDFSIFGNDFFQNEKPITDRSGIESCAVDDFFRGRRRFDITVKELREDYECDESACLTFMEPEAFSFFLPLFMKIAICYYDESENIPDSVVYKLHRMATGGANDWLDEIMKVYSKNQRHIIIEFLDEMSRIEWRHHVPDLASEAASLLRKKF
ncbi:DUF6714 family protein [Burkholderia multivorans]|uniref:DUF6714 family protein n=1 Tax=Burkholderia multivorans TaxID=87883 RepID=UPI0009E0DB88|nr:DUF6714 family protein [Burkholderia multivorans]SAJ61499.1 hypothetical protein UA16_03107 [Burkholderia multivorans]SAJ88637.1 hypothetical protein UA14_03430 [Burkholderia multivorans]HEM7809815.1 hypothetical protein [Burkholderia multivorans]HEM7815369.1 hypothetical protein [Burkholderia multivorans]HEM7820424.1 hypothetical protein [Burkholderia multivorans]